MAGYSKIENCCVLAIQDGFKYVWIDTCCIDKTSSSELSEAINSMYRWYQSATVCYAYLSDVETGDDPSNSQSQLSKSRWFTRGWTLQELLAPRTVVFYDCHWAEIGTKASLLEDISRITSIPCEALSNEQINEISIAQRMSWAAMRETTRVEDTAYCLMGMFGVNMPTLYGEGQQAFIRLQHEIMKNSDDHSLFAWASVFWIKGNSALIGPSWSNPEDDTFLDLMLSQEKQGAESGLLATSPKQFQHAQGVRRVKVASSEYPYSMTNKGLHIRLPMVQVRIADQEIYQAILSCEMSDGIGPLSIYLKRNLSGRYSRILTGIVCTAHNVRYDHEPVELYVKEAYPEDSPLSRQHQAVCHFHLVENPSVEHGYTLVDCGRRDRWDQKTHTLRVKVRGPYTSGRSAISYAIVGANSDRAAQAMVILGAEDPHSNYKPKFSCAVYTESSEIEEALVAFRHIEEGNISPETDDFVEAIGGVHLDRITKQLPSGHIISIAIRPGPGTTDYRVVMMFKPPFSYRTTPSNLPFPSHVHPSPVAPRPIPSPVPRQNVLSVAPRLVPPRPIAPLPKLTIHLASLSATVSFYPKQNWTMSLPCSTQPLLWIPTEQHNSGLLGLSTSGKLMSFLLIFQVDGSDIALELVPTPSDLGPPSTWDDVLSSYVDKVGPLQRPTRKRYQLPSDFPLEIPMENETMRVQLRRRMLLHEVGHQMLVTFKEKVWWDQQRMFDGRF